VRRHYLPVVGYRAFSLGILLRSRADCLGEQRKGKPRVFLCETTKVIRRRITPAFQPVPLKTKSRDTLMEPQPVRLLVTSTRPRNTSFLSVAVRSTPILVGKDQVVSTRRAYLVYLRHKELLGHAAERM
jgi:hypothetical protein